MIDDPYNSGGANAARTAVLVLMIMVLIAGILGISTGIISDKTLQMPDPTPADSITIP